MRFLATSLLVAGAVIWATGCDAPGEGPEVPPQPDPIDQPAPDPMDQPVPDEPEGWDQHQGAMSDGGEEPTAEPRYEPIPVDDTAPFDSAEMPSAPTPPDSVEQPVFGEPAGLDEPEDRTTGVGGEPGLLVEHDESDEGEEPVFSTPGMSSDMTGEN